MKIIFIGAININNAPRGGEEYKNKLMVGLLNQSHHLICIDTYDWKNRPLLLIKMLYSIFFKSSDRIILSASSMSVYRLVNFLSRFKRISGKTIYFVIGGYFHNGVACGIYKFTPYNTLFSLVVEGNQMRESLLSSGINTKVYVLQNFKKFDMTPTLKVVKDESFIKFVFISRIHPDKGVLDIFEAVNVLNLQGIDNFSVTFFGPIDPVFESHFNSLLNRSVVYGGYLNIMDNPEDSYRKLSEYDTMLFPSYWVGEGFPGVIVDAFVAGLPVIASDWNLNTEIIKDGINGLIIPCKNPEAMAMAMQRLISDPDLRNKLSVSAAAYAGQYNIDNLEDRFEMILRGE